MGELEGGVGGESGTETPVANNHTSLVTWCAIVDYTTKLNSELC